VTPAPSWTIARVEHEADLDAVVAIETASFSNPWTRDMYVTELNNHAISHIYALRDGNLGVVGFCAFWLIFDEIHINNLAVLPQYRGCGYGTALLRFVMAEGGRLGARRATLEVRRSNTAAQRLYARMGFRVVGTRLGYYTGPVEDALILWREGLDP
jgi:[ribosomal protein S18]-alanine N-acetyltransferase